jgi:hypothetical protein
LLTSGNEMHLDALPEKPKDKSNRNDGCGSPTSGGSTSVVTLKIRRNQD